MVDGSSLMVVRENSSNYFFTINDQLSTINYQLSTNFSYLLFLYFSLLNHILPTLLLLLW